jgi:CSLREA domain-containing protein
MSSKPAPYALRSLALAAGALLGLMPGGSEAATYTITTLADDAVVNGNCTLREALLAASTDSTNDMCVGDLSPDTIVLEATGTYLFQGGEILSAARSITVRGDGDHASSSYDVDLGGQNRLIRVFTGSSLTLENFTLRSGFGAARGGAVEVENSDLTLRRMSVLDSRATEGGGVSFFAANAQTLDVEESTFAGNLADGDQAQGGGLFVHLQGAGSSVRIVASSFVTNEIFSASGSFSRSGAGLYVESFADATVELRQLDFFSNSIDAPSFSSGAGARLLLSSQGAGSLLAEDLDFEDNNILNFAGSNGDAAFSVFADGGTATLRRIRAVENFAGTTRAQVTLNLTSASLGKASDFLVADGDGWGLFLSTSGSASLVAGNLTVAGADDSGLVLAENGGSLRVENSIAFGNATSTGSNIQVFNGSPDVSAETLDGVDPGFVNAANGDYRLGPASVAANAGNASFVSVGPFDLAHGTRVVGANLDLGALERGAIFADGFERNELYAWSSAVP